MKDVALSPDGLTRASMELCASHGRTLFTHWWEAERQLVFGCLACHVEEEQLPAAEVSPSIPGVLRGENGR